MIHLENLGGVLVLISIRHLGGIDHLRCFRLSLTSGPAGIAACPSALFTVDSVYFPHVTVAYAQLLRDLAEAQRIVLIDQIDHLVPLVIGNERVSLLSCPLSLLLCLVDGLLLLFLHCKFTI